MAAEAHYGGAASLKEAPLAQLSAMRESQSETGGVPPQPEMKVTHEEMKAARVPLLFRDFCAHLLIPLNDCRVKTWYSPFKCTELRHSYEKCQYDEFTRRVAIAQAEKAGGDE